jgi:NAD(P)-dependent dehydrogenase (short-subunit alcohol dehydrogenase family)
MSPLGSITEEHFDKVFNINVKGLLFTVQKALPLFADGGSIILNASMVASTGLGVIGSAWNLFGTPTGFVLDHRGVIRYRQIGIPDKQAIDGVLNKLIREAEASSK